MSFLFRGKLCGRLCNDCEEPIFPGVVKLYRIDPDELKQVHAQVAAAVKETAGLLTDKEVAAREKRLLGQAKTDAEGKFSLQLEPDSGYNGEPVEVHLYLPEAPNQPSGRSRPTPRQFIVTVWQPRWRQNDNDFLTYWEYCFPSRLWCAIRALFDAWVICGKVVNTNNQPLPGITVRAMDSDWITDDFLGEAVTDSQGNFRIDYHRDDFRQTFLSPVFNTETPWPPFFNSGPDAYFGFFFGGTELFFEDSSVGRTSGRENIGPCFCVTLRLPDIEIPPPENPPAAFNYIGKLMNIHRVTNINPADGRTVGLGGLDNHAFYGSMFLRGFLEQQLNGQPMEYKFEFREYADPANLASAVGPWQPITKAMMGNCVVGETWQLVTDPTDPDFPIRITGRYAINPAPGEIEVQFAGDWAQVPQVSNLHFTGEQIRLNSNNLDARTFDMSGLIPGNSTSSVPALSGGLPANRFFALRMWKRELGNAATEVLAGTSRPLAICNLTYADTPQNGSWLPTTSSEPGVACLDLVHLATGGGCATLGSSLEVRYAAANPNLGNVTLSMTGPGGPHAFSAVTVPTPGEEAYGTATYTGNVAALPDCAYLVRVHAEMRLVNGESKMSNRWDEVAFCK
ncbi:MAG: hypothetical protein AAGI38_15135 [Bacteroidota bacterium]